MKVLPEPLSFEWDKGNIDKNVKKHGVTTKQIEQAFQDTNLFIVEDALHSLIEERYMAWAKTPEKRRLSIIFTLRGESVRVISARDMNKKERRVYEQKI